MSHGLVTAAYIISAVLFILALAGLSKQETAKRGNLSGIIGMIIALIATIFGPQFTAVGFGLIVAAMIIGAIIGIRLALKVEMTGMPELIAMLHSFVGLAAVLVGFCTYINVVSPAAEVPAAEVPSVNTVNMGMQASTSNKSEGFGLCNILADAGMFNKTGCEKVNIIAHSKGGLDSRYAVSCLGMDKYVASLTTINTPHRGCEFADWLLDKAPESLRNTVADKYNTAFKLLGDTSPDFLGAVSDLTASSCRKLNEIMPDSDNVYYQSVGSKINNAVASVFPLNFSHMLASYFDGPNDGLVAVSSAKWGSNFTYLESKSPDGVSHADVIDLMRHDKPDLDIREFYVQLVAGLKVRGF